MKNYLIIGLILLLFCCQEENKPETIRSLFSNLPIINSNKIEINYLNNKVDSELKGERLKYKDYYLVYQDIFFKDTLKFLTEHYDYNYFTTKIFATKNDFILGKMNTCDEQLNVIIRQEFTSLKHRMHSGSAPHNSDIKLRGLKK